MAHYAKLDIENNVIAINVLNNQDNINSLGVEDESIGIEFLTKTKWMASLEKSIL
jgi:hypothetical protein